MCCFFAALVFFGPRLGFLIYWLIAPVRVNAAFATFNLPWLVGLAGLIFAPWTALMYVMIFPLNGFDWVWLGFGIMADVASYIGGYQNRKAVPYYPDTAP
jgi:apolipoprotein N-acyltransferase